jgi:uncharacterized protein
MVDPTPNTGFAIPLQIDSTGGIAEATDADKIRLSVLTILGTQPGERLMRPSFGCPLRNLAFAPLNAATANLAQFYVQDALTRWEVQASAITDQDGQPRLLVNVHYHVSASGQAQRVSFQLPLA